MKKKEQRRIPPLRWRILIWLGLFSLVPLFGRVYLAQPTWQSSPPSEASVSADSLERHVRILADELAPRSAAHFKNLNRSADYIASEFQKIEGGQLTEQTYNIGKRRYRNISFLIGSGNEPRIILGAHYDGYADSPGADDNASGVAGILELARWFATNQIASPIECVAYTLEEPPYFASRKMGSWQHASAMQDSDTACKYMIAVEMIGYFSDEWWSQSYPMPLLKLIYPNRGNFIAVVGNRDNANLIKELKIGMKGATGLPIQSICAPSALPGIDFSDHRNYWDFGLPAVMVTDTAFYRNREYHTVNDTPDRLDYQRMAQCVVALINAIERYESK